MKRRQRGGFELAPPLFGDRVCQLSNWILRKLGEVFHDSLAAWHCRLRRCFPPNEIFQLPDPFGNFRAARKAVLEIVRPFHCHPEPVRRICTDSPLP